MPRGTSRATLENLVRFRVGLKEHFARLSVPGETLLCRGRIGGCTREHLQLFRL